MSWLTYLFCRHKWEKVSEGTIDQDISDGWNHIYTHWITRRTVLIKCDKCGTLKRVVI